MRMGCGRAASLFAVVENENIYASCLFEIGITDDDDVFSVLSLCVVLLLLFGFKTSSRH